MRSRPTPYRNCPRTDFNLTFLFTFLPRPQGPAGSRGARARAPTLILILSWGQAWWGACRGTCTGPCRRSWLHRQHAQGVGGEQEKHEHEERQEQEQGEQQEQHEQHEQQESQVISPQSPADYRGTGLDVCVQESTRGCSSIQWHSLARIFD